MPDFTPPELHGLSLKGVIRSKEHDCFALGVVIFQLLFLGRHPYAGRYSGGDLQLEQMIARNLFAYSIKRNTSVVPPSAMLTLQDFPYDIVELFERCFGLVPKDRPTPSEWITALTCLEANLNRCNTHNTHYFPSEGKSCPWCKIENMTGAILFLSYYDIGQAGVAQSSIDIERLWKEIEQISLPDLHSVHPPIGQITKPPPSLCAQKAKKSPLELKKYIAVIIIIGVWISAPQLSVVWFFALIFAWSHLGSSNAIRSNEWQNKFSKADEAYDRLVDSWLARIDIHKLHALKKNLEEASNEYRALPKAKELALKKLIADRRNRQLQDFLDKYPIRNASISGIGPAKTVTLASYGIETAADIFHHTIIKVPGFGDATAAKLIKWRQALERDFVYNPTPTREDAQAKAKIEAEFSSKSRTLANKLVGGKQELAQLGKTATARLATCPPELTTVYAERLQAEIDLEFLGVAKPYKNRQSAPTIPNPAATRPITLTTSSNNPVCPQCGALMVRRIARRGSNHGKSFWGCSRFPRCRGTRT